jgi:hypothetical protein
VCWHSFDLFPLAYHYSKEIKQYAAHSLHFERKAMSLFFGAGGAVNARTILLEESEDGTYTGVYSVWS